MTRSAALRQGMIANLTNPTVLAFMLAFLPQFVDPADGPVVTQLLILGATMKGIGLLTLSSVALAAGTVGDWLARRPGFVLWQRRFAGAVMIALALRLVLSGQASAAGR